MNADSISHYDYTLPPDLIAREPLPERDQSRLLVLSRKSGAVEHKHFHSFPELLDGGDLLVLNQTKVVPARLRGLRAATGGRWEGLFLGTNARGEWRLIGTTRGKLRSGESIRLVCPGETDRLNLQLIEKSDEGEWIARPDSETSTFELLDRFGTVPLPPYMERESPTADDRERYQTTFARTPGAVAAPTAGLHFTPEVLDRCRQRGVQIAFVTLHVGYGTFRPVSVEKLQDHVMHPEWCQLPEETARAIQATRKEGGRIVAVGTTTVRTLESVAARGPLTEWTGETNLFIRPPYQFRVVDALLTNFHLPKSTLLVLVSTFAGHGRIMSAYSEAIERRYRFYSYGDAMFIT